MSKLINRERVWLTHVDFFYRNNDIKNVPYAMNGSHQTENDKHNSRAFYVKRNLTSNVVSKNVRSVELSTEDAH